jgi:hypothetical protein
VNAPLFDLTGHVALVTGGNSVDTISAGSAQ